MSKTFHTELNFMQPFFFFEASIFIKIYFRTNKTHLRKSVLDEMIYFVFNLGLGSWN